MLRQLRKLLVGVTTWALVIPLIVGAASSEELSEKVTNPLADKLPERHQPPAVPEVRSPLRLGDPSTGQLSGTCTVSSENRAIRAGDPLNLEIVFNCDGGWADVYDPFYCKGDPSRAALRVFDATGKFVGNALSRVPFDMPERHLWVRARQGTIMGRGVQIETGEMTSYAAGASPPDGDHAVVARLAAGKYSVQLVLFGHFLDSHLDGELTPHPTVLDVSQEICRSSVFELEIAPRAEPAGSEKKEQLSYKASLIVKEPRLPVSEFTIKVYNRSDKGLALLNPLFNPLVPVVTADLVVFDGEGNRIGRLFETGPGIGGSMQSLDDGHWVTIPPRSIIGMKGKARYIGLSSANMPPKPGAWSIQMVFRDAFVSESPFTNLGSAPDPKRVESLKKWQQDHPGKELFRSNAIKILDVE